MSVLPQPDADALAHCQAVIRHIRAEIESCGGWIPFSRYMELALYAPGLGYYTAGAAKLGAEGDFVTAPEISPLFGRVLARQVSQVLERTGGDVLELGAGSGRLAQQLLGALDESGCPPRRYLILELSPDLRARQQQLLRRDRAPDRAERVEWLSALPASFTGVVVGNEVLDALPVHLLAWRREGIVERGVAWRNREFVWQERPLREGELRAAAEALAVGPGYQSEISLAAPALVRSLGSLLERGALLFVDYGFGASEYYHPQRAMGTLMCHYRHRSHGDPFHLPGLQDITAHVDFSAVARAGRDVGLDVLGYTGQARFLVNCGITELLGAMPTQDTASYLPAVAGVQRLLSPAEMGELFKVIALGRGLPPGSLTGFRTGDRSHTLLPGYQSRP